MKKIQKLLTGLVLILFIVSCNKDSNQPQPQSSSSGGAPPSKTITDSMYLGSWILNGIKYNNIGPDGVNPYSYSNYDDCNTVSVSNNPETLQFRNDTMVFNTTNGYEWLYTCDGDTMWSGIGTNTSPIYYLKCN